MKEIILATSNQGKIAELSAILAPTVCIPQSSLAISDAEETGQSFVENALIKARHASRESGKPALADDSGLVVPALDGRPGIYSSRFAGPSATDKDNIDLLLHQLKDVPEAKRQAFFYCAIVMVRHANDPMPLIACGQLKGQISRTLSGDQGFGYDPVFYLPERQCTMAQLPARIKNTISHRAEALQRLQQQLNPS
ncbi:non-canonical purine NTP pyrophosphatase, RdgB/HAM1 family [Legionella taurinensis]|uniref:dITP/XTP pyrophosphatase n=1 Tax=Legionella taurinensis TaxID=70611 RepID=A0A3A5L2C3_9GAMM|nr:RdgB/HAM1 family non-canonical purine NTP pyrophosphatase [Legionella taurinensis]MDX1838572.1 RdgB/HAM1 family non-canonical purine NTP pyrophosphatase [Legionella taurinensis]PUT39018.1 non-canonical purine NTP pyrophosphatase, RdgB/HAM1 family [Legionella taurinensis]PUT41105.1 non-canonical purine NTP pyrophosphatase, RdgB/HAM1 family [Legionella taurinensis]PUT43480.1 non-canonical purine NTP pyrophosphatase, RdgB/HAM1 family [Legionella taurinensis]PUT46497.1 non-canonical purine NTP 